MDTGLACLQSLSVPNRKCVGNLEFFIFVFKTEAHKTPADVSEIFALIVEIYRERLLQQNTRLFLSLMHTLMYR